MNMPIVLPSREYLQDCFSYNEETGILTWKERPLSHFKYEKNWIRFKRLNAGKPAGIEMYRDREKSDKICLRVKMHVDGRKIYPSAHRLIFALKGIEIPMYCYPDHKNGDPFDNRWDNLRIATPSQNAQNKRNERNRQHELPKGVHMKRKKDGTIRYRASISIDGKVTTIGAFDTPEKAHERYCMFSKILHGEFHRPA